MAPKQTSHHHRSTLSQSNKSFKARHATKGALKQLSKGRVEKELKQSLKAHAQTAAGQKAARKNHAKQLQAEKRRAQADSIKVFSGSQPAPRIVLVIALSADIDPYNDVLVRFKLAAGLPLDPEEPTASSFTFSWPTANSFQKPNSNGSLLQFILVPHSTPIAHVISLAAAADFLLPVLSAQEECTPWGERCLRSIQAIGGASLGTLGLAFGLDTLNGPDLPVKHQQSAQTRASLLSFLRYFFPDTLLLARVSSLDSLEEVGGLARRMLEKKPAAVSPGWRDGRARLVSERIEWADGTLKITGHVRGGRFSSNRLVHVPFCGDYRLSKITITRNEDKDEEEEVVVCTPDPELADDLVSENCPSTADAMMAEQTWPTEEEIASAPANKAASKPKRTRKIPVGTSDYQAAWIPEGQEDEYADGDEAEFEDPLGGDSKHDLTREEEEEEMADMDDDMSEQGQSSKGVRFMDLSDDIEKLQLEEYRANREQQRTSGAREDEEFPDEIDTPLHIPARERFARYRGMKSLRTSPWDPYENLPAEYGKVFGFQDWKVMSKKLCKKANEDQPGVGAGMRVTLHVAEFPQDVFESLPRSLPLIAVSLLQHEHKYSVMHFSTQRNTEYEGEIKSKDQLVICVGYRFYSVNPIWSQPSVRASNNVHKFERYLRHGRMNVGTVYMPVTFGSTTPVVVLQEVNDDQGTMELVGSGTLVGSEPKRIVVKRFVLTGHPYKVHKKTATIRYMFFNRDDIEYFKPVELRTKKGRSGHIKEPLGTHGYFKAGFDGPIDQMDTICMSLYKRCFPKWAHGWNGSLKSICWEEKEDGKEMEVDE